MISQDMIDKIVTLARNQGGVTADIAQSKIIENLDEWVFPRWPDLTSIVPENRLEASLVEFMNKHNREFAEKKYLGMWRDKNNMYYIDVNVHIKKLAEARRLAKTYSKDSSRGIISLYNPAKNKLEYL